MVRNNVASFPFIRVFFHIFFWCFKYGLKHQNERIIQFCFIKKNGAAYCQLSKRLNSDSEFCISSRTYASGNCIYRGKTCRSARTANLNWCGRHWFSSCYNSNRRRTWTIKPCGASGTNSRNCLSKNYKGRFSTRHYNSRRNIRRSGTCSHW